MFEKLAQYEFTRNRKQAFGFYLAYLFLALLIGALVSTIEKILMSAGPFEGKVFAESITLIIYCITLACVVAYKKALSSSFKVLLIIALTAVISVFLGSFGGLIPVAYLTTIPANENT